MEAYNGEDYPEATKHFEASITAFYEAEELCRASCEVEYLYDEDAYDEQHRKRFHQQIIGNLFKTCIHIYHCFYRRSLISYELNAF